MQVQGLGTRLVNRFKGEMAARGVRFLLTTADDYAINFWAQMGFSRNVTLPRAIWRDRLEEYDGGVLMECVLHGSIPYTRMPHARKYTHIHAKTFSFLCTGITFLDHRLIMRRSDA